MTREEAIDIIRNSSFSEHSDFLISLLRPSATVDLHDLAESLNSASPRSFFGGQPLLPKGWEWPVWDRRERLKASIKRWESKIDPAPEFNWMRQMICQWKDHLDDGPMPLPFLGQLSLNEIDRDAPLENWPVTGSLAFFFGDSAIPGNAGADKGHCRVIYVPEDIAASPAAFPDALDASFRYPKLYATFHREWSLPSEPSHPPSDSCSWMNLSYLELLEALQAPSEPSPRARHQCGGHPQIIQGAMEPQCQMVAENLNWDTYGRLNPEQKAEFNSRAESWQLLVQFDSDERLGWTWSDVGKVYFWAPPQDVASKSFENALALLQSS